MEKFPAPSIRAAVMGAVSVLALSAAFTPTRAQTNVPYPSKPLRVIVPLPAGGPTDILARIVATPLQDRLGQAVVIDNRPGAGGNIGAEIVARSSPDGYTLFAGTSGPLANNISLYAKLPFDPVRDFSPIALVASAPFVLAVHPSVPVTNVKEFIAYAKARPGQLNYGAVPGAAAHLATEMFRSLAGIDIVHVPYKGAGPATTDVIAGQIQFTFASTPGAIPHVKSGKLRALAVTSTKRVAQAPEIPTVAEGGGPVMSAEVWYGFVAPAKTPREIVNRLHTDIVQIVQTPATRDRMLASDFEPRLMAPDEFAAFIKSEIARWGKVIRSAKITAD
ncbi:MAG: tripartite tricarboxylate transporter substrate binding protein [Proteobacteria bacterium]|nr:tripartite tricarboxylate transporter substrate binding protein [Burkholderiales bacterium]